MTIPKSNEKYKSYKNMAQVAKELGISSTTVKNHLSEENLKLKEKVNDDREFIDNLISIIGRRIKFFLNENINISNTSLNLIKNSLMRLIYGLISLSSSNASIL